MKYTIPLGALLLLGIAAGVHRVSGESLLSDPQPVSTVEVRPVAAVAETRPASGGNPERSAEAPSTPAIPTPVPSRSQAEEAAPWRKLSNTLNQSLSLTTSQEGRVEQILRERTEEIRVCHAEMRRAQLIDVQQYEWQVARMKESWFKRIDALLDARQHRQFVLLAEQGFFNDGLGFTVDPGMTVLD